MSFASRFGKYKDRYTPLKNGNRAVCVCAQSIIITSSTKRESTVAIAAPSTPSFGKPSFPKIRSQLNTRFTSTAAPLPIMGTEIPLVEYTPSKDEKPPYSFYSTSDSLDEARIAFERVKELTADLATVETSAYRLAESIKKTQKRANALKNITIPSYQTLVKDITNALEEKDREEFTRLKVIKRSTTK